MKKRLNKHALAMHILSEYCSTKHEGIESYLSTFGNFDQKNTEKSTSSACAAQKNRPKRITIIFE